MKILATVGVWLLALAARAAFAQSPNDVAAAAFEVFEQRCFRCHGGASGTNAELDVLSGESLLQTRGDGDVETAFVVPGEPDRSLLWQAVETSYMPLEGSAEAKAITPDEKAAVKTWIAAGAPLPERRKIDRLATADVLRAVREHLQSARAEERRHLRFFSLAHLHNNPAVSDRDLRYQRAALSKLLNSLLWRKKRFVSLAPVEGTHETVYAFDVRELDWDRDGAWDAILAAYPYGAHFEFAEDETLRGLQADVTLFAGTKTPVVRSDWFVVNAAQHPLYTRLMDLPATMRELEERLGFDSVENFREGKLARASFTRSNVSSQNRSVERHATTDGACWVSYDFKPRRARGDLVRFPLGPSFGEHPFPQLAFEHDGGEVIFNLPNGLQGYMLLKGDGTRLDAPGPIDVVYDSSAIAGSPEIVNALSCMHCHSRGVIKRFRDEVRFSKAVSGPAQRKVEDLHPPHDVMQRLLDEDEARFLAAQEKVTGPYLVPGDEGEPIGKVVARYNADLSFVEVACELGLVDPDGVRERIAVTEDLLELGLGTLSEDPPGKLKRAKWEALEGTSLFQETLTHFERGAMPVRPSATPR